MVDCALNVVAWYTQGKPPCDNRTVLAVEAGELTSGQGLRAAGQAKDRDGARGAWSLS